MNCTHCRQPLKISQYSSDLRLKSCPRCSQNHSKNIHIYYSNNAFGKTIHRQNQNNLEGIQSHCTSCRAENGPNINDGIPCNMIE